MNNLDKQYQALLNDILANGVKKEDRTGTGTISVFSRQIRHKMSEGFPLLTTKKMPFKTVVTELIWFLRGDTNIKFLLDYDCHIWDGDAFKHYIKVINDVIDGYKCGDIMGMQPHMETWFSDSNKLIPLTKEEFINKIKTDGEFAKKWGELGPIYGKQWRNWTERSFTDILNRKISYYGNTEAANETAYEEYKNSNIDQIQNLISELKTNPDSRRLMVNAWNVGELDQMVLPPCHYGFQVYTRELSLDERVKFYYKKHRKDRVSSMITKSILDHDNIPTRAISLMWNQRSVDTFLGLPFNIASYALLLEIIANEVNMLPDELIGNLGDVHLYSNHIEQAREQIGGPLHSEKRREMLEEAMGAEAYKRAVDELMPFGGGLSEYYDSYKIPYSSREPYTLPNLVFLDEYHYINDIKLVGEIPFNEKINQFRPDFFKIENYQSHPAIKALLSN